MLFVSLFIVFKVSLWGFWNIGFCKFLGVRNPALISVDSNQHLFVCVYLYGWIYCVLLTHIIRVGICLFLDLSVSVIIMEFFCIQFHVAYMGLNFTYWWVDDLNTTKCFLHMPWFVLCIIGLQNWLDTNMTEYVLYENEFALNLDWYWIWLDLSKIWLNATLARLYMTKCF